MQPKVQFKHSQYIDPETGKPFENYRTVTMIVNGIDFVSKSPVGEHQVLWTAFSIIPGAIDLVQCAPDEAAALDTTPTELIRAMQAQYNAAKVAWTI